MKANHDYQIGDKVLFPSVDNAPFLVVGIRANHLEIEGDFSGGTHCVRQRDWVSIAELEYYPESQKNTFSDTLDYVENVLNPPTFPELEKRAQK